MSSVPSSPDPPPGSPVNLSPTMTKTDNKTPADVHGSNLAPSTVAQVVPAASTTSTPAVVPTTDPTLAAQSAPIVASNAPIQPAHPDVPPAVPTNAASVPAAPAASVPKPTPVTPASAPAPVSVPMPGALPGPMNQAPLGTPAIEARPKTPVLDLPPAEHSSTELPARARSPSSSSVQRPPERLDSAADLASHTTPKHDPQSHSAMDRLDKPSGLVLPQRPGIQKATSAGDLRSGLASPVIPNGAVESLIASVHADRPSTPNPLAIIILYAGKSHKAFSVHKHQLSSKSPYFKRLLADGYMPEQSEVTFEDLDEYAVALFVRWLYGGELHGPHDFHSFQHYLALYVLSQRFEVEALSNNVMDLCRTYYRIHSMTAPAYRIEYIYAFTTGPNHMRNFLVTTAAFRCICDAPPSPNEYLSGSMKDLVVKGGEIGNDFATALIKLSKNGIVDARRGPDCVWHEHSDGKFCANQPAEAWVDV
ncbi:hypothetical protein MBLNU457_7601t1 [Dothideomycetes sp. NU457]